MSSQVVANIASVNCATYRALEENELKYKIHHCFKFPVFLSQNMSNIAVFQYVVWNPVQSNHTYIFFPATVLH